MGRTKQAGKRKPEDEEDEEEDVEEGSPRKSKSRKVSADDEIEGFACELSKTRKVTVRSFKGKVLVDLREYYEKNDNWLPGKKGISLSVEQWKVLKENIEEIDRLIEEAS